MTQKTFLNNMILGGMFMKAEIFYNDKKIGKYRREYYSRIN